MQIANFFVFLFKWVNRNENGLNFEVNEAYLNIFKLVIDYDLLMEYLKDYNSIKLKDLLNKILEEGFESEQVKGVEKRNKFS